jgi:hypothetical protein
VLPWNTRGFLIAAVRVYQRVWQLYVAHVFLFMMFIAMVAYTADVLNSSLYAEEFGAPNFLNEPGLAAMKAPTLQFQPAFMDIPPLVQHFFCSSSFLVFDTPLHKENLWLPLEKSIGLDF